VVHTGKHAEAEGKRCSRVNSMKNAAFIRVAYGFHGMEITGPVIYKEERIVAEFQSISPKQKHDSDPGTF
jgi:hypothetical protein